MPWFRESEVAPETDQERVVDWPEVIEEGEAVKEEMVGMVEVETGGGGGVGLPTKAIWNKPFIDSK